MPRSIRVQYEGAYYHVMARGNRREAIFIDDDDRQCFLKTLGIACEMTGWRVHAWVLMPNHYHLFIETPEANLVDGMQWLQNTYTRKFNVRHKLWGRLFGDRYKAILVEGENNYYYETLLDYIHLNPVRAGIVRIDKEESLLTYKWSSLTQGYALPLEKRKAWMACDSGFASFGFLDNATGRRQMIKRLDQRALNEIRDECGIPVVLDKECARGSHLDRSWYWGTQAFLEKTLLLKESFFGKQQSRAYHAAPENKSHGLQQAEHFLQEGLLKANLSQENLNQLKGSDQRKIFLAFLLRKKTTVSNAWIAEQLKMRSAANVSQQLSRIDFKKIINSLPKDLVDYGMSLDLHL